MSNSYRWLHPQHFKDLFYDCPRGFKKPFSQSRPKQVPFHTDTWHSQTKGKLQYAGLDLDLTFDSITKVCLILQYYISKFTIIESNMTKINLHLNENTKRYWNVISYRGASLLWLIWWELILNPKLTLFISKV